MNKNSRIFIAGHNGLVGSAVHRNLQLRGYKNLLVISRKELDLKESKLLQH
jgi:GDP-L-fucose synthase